MRLSGTCLIVLIALVSNGAEPSLIDHSDGPRSSIPLSMMDGCDAGLSEIELNRFKRQPLQSVSVAAGLIGGLDDSPLKSQFVDVSIGSGIPLGSFDNIIGVTPRFRIDWMDAEPSLQIPTELYLFELQFFYRRPISDRLAAMAIVSPSIRSDLTTSDQAFRVFALGLLNWQWISDRVTVSGGVVFLGRADLPVLPAIGLSWTPNRLTRLDLQFPTSTLSRRIAKNGGQSEMWTYLSVGLGGDTWAVSRTAVLNDELSLRDLRLVLGIERIIDGGGGWFAEVGYALDRRLQYESDDSELNLGDAAVIQIGWRY